MRDSVQSFAEGLALHGLNVANGVQAAAAQPSSAAKGADPLLFYGGALALLAIAFAVVYLRLWRKCQTIRDDLSRQNALAKHSEQELHAVFSTMTSLVLEVDADCRIQRVFPTRYAFKSYAPEEMAGLRICDFIEPESGALLLLLITEVLESKTPKEGEFAGILGGGQTWFHVAGSPLTEYTVLLVGRDVTRERQYRDQLQQNVFTDRLTGLPNRVLFRDRLQQAMQRMQRKEGYNFSVLSIDLLRFKQANDSLGHYAGDELLKRVSSRLLSCLRRVDTAARFFGNEYLVLLDDIDIPEESEKAADRIIERLSTPFSVQGNDVYVAPCVGIVFGADHYTDPDQIIRDAGTAMQRAKLQQAPGRQVFHASMHEQAALKLKVEADMHKALERGEFELHYQPIVRLISREIVGFEALVRWRHPEMGLLYPLDFIPMTEENGMICQLGEWILEEACAGLARVISLLPEGPQVTLNVNLSGRQFQEKNLANIVEQAIVKANVPASLLKLEVTESLLMQNPQQASKTLHAIKEIGPALAIDDFGAGYSSLAYLYQFPFDMLKIDRSFVTLLTGRDAKQEQVIRAIMALAGNLGMEVVAEGVENQENVHALRNLGCKLGQGFFYAKPMERERLESLLQRAKSGVLAIPPSVH